VKNSVDPTAWRDKHLDWRPVLDHGYVRLLDVFGSEVTVPNAAWVRGERAATEMDASATRIAKWLFRDRPVHESPGRYPVLLFEVNAPGMVVRQWKKYKVGSVHFMSDDELIGVPSWVYEALLDYLYGGNGDEGRGDDPFHVRNEESRRYDTHEAVPLRFYQPDAWRTKPETRKQGSGPDADESVQRAMHRLWADHIEMSMDRFYQAGKMGVATEMARCFLPFNFLYTGWRWQASLQAVAHFLGQRLEDSAQREIQAYAQAVNDLVLPHFPTLLPPMVQAEAGR